MATAAYSLTHCSIELTHGRKTKAVIRSRQRLHIALAHCLVGETAKTRSCFHNIAAAILDWQRRHSPGSLIPRDQFFVLLLEY